MVILPCLHTLRPRGVAIDLSDSADAIHITCDRCQREYTIAIMDCSDPLIPVFTPDDFLERYFNG